MELQFPDPIIIRTPTPQEVSAYLRGRGWHETNQQWGNYTHNNVQRFDWVEALAYENFLHLFHMKASDAPQNHAEVKVPSGMFEGMDGVTVKKY